MIIGRLHDHLSDVVNQFLRIKEETCLLIQSKNRFLSLCCVDKKDAHVSITIQKYVELWIDDVF